jgi:predicted nucleic acid-binding protein
VQVFGHRVGALLEAFEDAVSFYSPDVCFDDARKYIPDVSARRRIDPLLGLSVLDEVSNVVESVDQSLYEEYETIARERVTPRDPHDWPVVAVALLLDFPIWTEDQDFFGSGVATWTTDRVELYLTGE